MAGYLQKVTMMFKHVVTAESIQFGALHDRDTLFKSPWDSIETAYAAYGVNNRREGNLEDIMLPCLAQHLPAWSVLTATKRHHPYL